MQEYYIYIYNVYMHINIYTYICSVLLFGKTGKILHRLSKRLVSLGIMEDQLRASLKTSNTIVLWYLRGFRGPPQSDPMMPRHVIISDTSDRCSFFRPCSLVNQVGRNIARLPSRPTLRKLNVNKPCYWLARFFYFLLCNSMVCLPFANQ